MLKKVYSVFFALVVLFLTLTGIGGCSQRLNSPISQSTPSSTPSQEIPPPTTTPVTDAFLLTPNPSPISSPVAPSSPLVTSTLESQAITPPYEKPTPKKRNTVTQEIFMNLSSPELMGRVIGSAGGKTAQEIIIGLYSAMGLEPFGTEFKIPVFIYPFQSTDGSSDLKADGHNIVGLITGEESEECLILSAHFDGVDHGSAALDNAAGVYALLKTAEKLTLHSENENLSRDIVFAAFDGEEPGLIGSSAMVDTIKNRYEKVFVINLDCVGIKGSDSYIVIGDQAQWGSFIESLYELLDANGFVTVPISGFYASDHLAFEYQGIPAVTIGECEVDGIIHTVNDVAEKVDIDEIERLSEVLCTYVLEESDALFDNPQ